MAMENNLALTAHRSPLTVAPLHRSFNKRLEDFATRQEYDDYLEEREDISE
jgi:hypothetical protein